jgi:predicted CXXCH cytochrome family protein
MSYAARIVAALFFAAISLLWAEPSRAAEPNPHNAKLCLLCHKETPRFGVDTKETVTFRKSTWDDPQLCYHCHKPEENLHPLFVQPGPERHGTRAPSSLPLGSSPGLEGQVVCTTCHFLHAAETDHALLRGFAGSQRPGTFSSWQDFCRECHGEGLVKRSPHDGDDKACAFCHQARPEEGAPVDVAPRGVELCNFCHGAVQDRHFAKTNPFGKDAGCLDCHDPHLGPDRPARLKDAFFEAAKGRATISPHYRKALCFACHTEGEGYPLVNEDPVALCNSCHGTGEVVGDIHPLRKVPDSITPPKGWPTREGFLTCMTCHLAGHPEHEGTWKFLRGGPYEDRNDFCRNCHDPMSYGDRNPHRDINRGEGCEFCHAVRPVPGKDSIDTVKFIADPNILCLRCHAEDPHPAGIEHTITVDPERAETIDETFPVYRGTKIVCATCHNPHVEEVENHKLRGEMSGMMVCAGCHKY